MLIYKTVTRSTVECKSTLAFTCLHINTEHSQTDPSLIVSDNLNPKGSLKFLLEAIQEVCSSVFYKEGQIGRISSESNLTMQSETSTHTVPSDLEALPLEI
jgi:hypothetical protein